MVHVAMDVELREENRIDIDGLHRAVFNLDNRHDGKFFLGRTLTVAVNGLWVDVVVDDPAGDKTGILRLNNFTPAKYSRDGGKGDKKKDYLGILPPGSYIVVKNPTRGLMSTQFPAVLQVSSDNPGNVVILTRKRMKELFPDLEWMGTPPCGCGLFWESVGETDSAIMEALKKMGNEAFVYKRYTDALRCYDMALEYVGEQDFVGYDTIWSNKAAAFLGFGCFLKGLECCDKVLAREPNHVKCIHRKVKALVGLGRGSDALKFLTDKLNETPSFGENKDLRNLGSKIPLPGTIPVLDNVRKTFTLFDDFTTEYVGPLEFRPNSTGRGVFAIKDIQPGDVILFQRDFAQTEGFVHDNQHPEAVERQQLAYFELMGLVANKIAFSPELGPQIYKLWAGQELKTLEADDPEIGKVNIERIRGIVSLHQKLFVPTGKPCLTLKMQFMNHSCTEANILTIHARNWVINTATKLIKSGQEICNDWVESIHTLDARRKQLIRHGITCNCRLCLLESSEEPKIQEEAGSLVSRLHSLGPDWGKSRQNLKLILGIVTKLQQLRPSAPDLSLALIPCNIRAALCHALLLRGMFAELINLSEAFFKGAAATNHPKCGLDAVRNALVGNLKVKNLTKATEWAEEMKKIGVILFGCPTAPEAWDGRLIEEMSLAGMDICKVFGKV